MEGKQVAVLVPTTLLAEQHFITFSERFAPFPVTVKMLSRFVSHAEQKQVVDDVKAGKVDVVIGTHRLLGKDMAFREPRPADRRRGTAVRGRAQGAAEAVPRERRRAHDDGDADPAHARDGAHRHPRDEHDRHAARGPSARAHLRRQLRRGARARGGASRAAAGRPGLLGAQPGRDDRSAGGLAHGAAARGPHRRRARADGRGRPRAADDAVLEPRGRRAAVAR